MFAAIQPEKRKLTTLRREKVFKQARFGRLMKTYPIDAVLFDFDGTLTKPGSIDFKKVKKSIGCPEFQSVLEYIEKIPHPEKKHSAIVTLDQMEMVAAKKSEPNIGAESLLSELCFKSIPIGIISRNSSKAIHAGLDNFKRITAFDFNIIISRDSPVKPKPSGDGILQAASEMKVDVKRIAMVGDFIFDIQAGREAGAVTVFIDNGCSGELPKVESDAKISQLAELLEILRLGEVNAS